MNLLQLKQLFSYFVDDLALGYFTPPQATAFINLGVRECQKKLIQAGANYNLTIVTQPTQVNLAYYELPCDFLKLNNLETLQDPTNIQGPVKTIKPITLNQKATYPLVGEPECYYFLSKKLVMVPTPNIVTTMQLTYTYMVAELSNDGDVPDLPEVYAEYIVLLAVQAAFLKDGRSFSDYNVRLAEYEKRMREDYQQRNVDGPRMIVCTSDDAGGIFY